MALQHLLWHSDETRVSPHPRVDLLATEFERFGMTKPAAATLSSEVVLRHSLVRKLGVPKLAQRFVCHGVAQEDATHLALTLWGLERLLLGDYFHDLLASLRHAGVGEADAYPACIEARRLWRDAAALPEVEADIQLARWCIFFLATLVFVSTLMQLGGLQ